LPALAIEEESAPSMYFISLSAGNSILQTFYLYIVPCDTFVIDSLSWSPTGNNIRVEIVPRLGGTTLGWIFSGGSVVNFAMSMSSLSDGDYSVSIKNVGSSTVTEVLHYHLL
jgi:hypothetical protein